MTAVCFCMAWMGCKKENGSITVGEEDLVVETGSLVSWKGYLETGYFNSGTVEMDAEDFRLKGDEIRGGDIRIPVYSIVVTNDLPPAQKLELAHHLQSVDFFNLALYPHVVYSVTSAQKMSSVDANGNNYLITGSLQLLGKSLPLDIPANVTITNTHVIVATKFTFDRTRWGMTYATDTSLPAAERIKNDIEVELNLRATRF